MMDGSFSEIKLFDQVNRFVVAASNDELTHEEWVAFEHLLRESDDACRLYFEYVEESDFLQTMFDSTPEEMANSSLFGITPLDSTSSVPAPDAGLLGSAVGNATGFFGTGWPVAYLVATLVFGLGLLIASLIHVSQPMESARSSPGHQTEGLVGRSGVGGEDSASPIVGRITGMVGCKWVDPTTEAINGDDVQLGRKYDLASGLMEITYDTGANVILQGPVTYEVESKNGGFMSVGKLTGKMEVETAKGFAVRTPTATVADLGTEFGVEVDTSGNTTCEVFVGEVRMARFKDGLAVGETKSVRAGEAAVVRVGAKGVASQDFHPTTFVRALGRARRPQFLVTTAGQQPFWWRYSEEKPADDWMQPRFDDSFWRMGKAIFGCAGGASPNRVPQPDRLPRPTIATAWTSAGLWVRQDVVVTDAKMFGKAILTLLRDNDVEVFVNGQCVCSAKGARDGYIAVDVTKKLRTVLKEGVNTIAAHASGAPDLYQAFDLGLTLDPKGDCLPPRPLLASELTGRKIGLIPTVAEGAAEWYWTTDNTTPDWKTAKVDWKQGKAGFGAKAPPSLTGTAWTTDDLWLRKDVDLGELPENYLGVLRLIHDDDIEVYINGKLVFAETGFSTEMQNIDVTKRLKTVLRKGPNAIAVHVAQKMGWVQYVDLGLSLWTTTPVAPAKQ